jgi:EAL domain-containing protein (putative c-di-GMP-specific phosphodiesterase class I)
MEECILKRIFSQSITKFFLLNPKNTRRERLNSEESPSSEQIVSAIQIAGSPLNELNRYKQFFLRNDLKKALLRNEIDILYHPRINPITNEIKSAEALICWNHPKWGRVLLDEFILLADNSGLVIPIGEWFMRNVCNKLKSWKEDNIPLKKISINLSLLQIMQPNFVDMVSSILREFNVNSKWIEFEVSETVLIEREEQMLQTLTSLKNLGITIALDDFGKGYSSINFLTKLPCEIIKIDKSLIKDIHIDKDNFEITSSIISLCHKLQKQVVAEGVETSEQLSILQKLNCDEIQGYLYSNPIDEIEYNGILKAGFDSKVENEVASSNDNLREYFRIPLKNYLLADMTIEEIENQKVKVGSTEILIKDIGAGGLSFYSTLKLPINKNFTLLFATEIFSIEWRIKGSIVWYKELEDNYNLYGVKFILKEAEQENLLNVLYTLQIRLKQKSILPGCRFNQTTVKLRSIKTR